MDKKNIVAFHLLNDYSGSPKVLAQVLDGLAASGAHVTLVTSRGPGALDEVDKSVERIGFDYSFSKIWIVELFRFIAAQMRMARIARRKAKDKDTIFYVNTILCPLPARVGWMKGLKVICHYHENAQAKGFIYKVLSRAMCRFATAVICVSDYQKSFLKRKDKVTVIPNSLPARFAESLAVSRDSLSFRNILMLSSLKAYKGVDKFILLANRMRDFNFTLIVNDSQEATDKFLKEHGLQKPENLSIHNRQKDVTPFYREASLVLNLTDPDLAVETFGLTALEAMTAGIPAIVPPVGGIAEMVEDGVNGYKISQHDIEGIRNAIEMLFSDRDLYGRMCRNASEKAKEYSEEKAIKKILQLI